MSVTVNIAGDFCITPAYTGKDLLSPEIKAIYQAADINIINLECPVNEHGDAFKIIKHGPHLQAANDIFDRLKELKTTAITLANNHILDYGIEGLASTVKACEKNNILHAGVGSDLKDAAKHIIIEKNDLKIAVVNFCENEWSIATDETAGANPLDIIENLQQIKKAKAGADIVLVIVHGGTEYYNLPSPRMVKQYRFFAENGADAVIGHHTHCISGTETHQGVPIIYGLGNMLFTKKSDEPGWVTGLTAQLVLEKGKAVQYSLIPTRQEKDGFRLSVAGSEDKAAILQEVKQYSTAIADDKKLAAAWNAMIEKRAPQYLYNFSAVPVAPGRFIKSTLRRMGFVSRLLPKKYLAGIINYISCEAHLDISREVLRKKLFKK